MYFHILCRRPQLHRLHQRTARCNPCRAARAPWRCNHAVRWWRDRAPSEAIMDDPFPSACAGLRSRGGWAEVEGASCIAAAVLVEGCPSFLRRRVGQLPRQQQVLHPFACRIVPSGQMLAGRTRWGPPDAHASFPTVRPVKKWKCPHERGDPLAQMSLLHQISPSKKKTLGSNPCMRCSAPRDSRVFTHLPGGSTPPDPPQEDSCGLLGVDATANASRMHLPSVNGAVHCVGHSAGGGCLIVLQGRADQPHEPAGLQST